MVDHVRHAHDSAHLRTYRKQALKEAVGDLAEVVGHVRHLLRSVQEVGAAEAEGGVAGIYIYYMSI